MNKERENEWRKWLKSNKTNEMVWPFNAWELYMENDDLRIANHKLLSKLRKIRKDSDFWIESEGHGTAVNWKNNDK